jgi:hypothetical protein
LINSVLESESEQSDSDFEDDIVSVDVSDDDDSAGSVNVSDSEDSQVKWVTCHHGMARRQVADRGDGLQMWGVAANILNKQSRTADRGWTSSLGVVGGNNPPP